MSEFTCAKCGGTFDKVNDDAWNDFKAAEEYLTLYPEAKNDSTEIVCDDCYKEFRLWFNQLTDEQKRQIREDYHNEESQKSILR